MEEGSGNEASLSMASLSGEPGGRVCSKMQYCTKLFMPKAVKQAISKGTLTKSRPI